MWPVVAYRITPNLFGQQRWQAEIASDHPANLHARRAYSAGVAHAKMSNDVEGNFQGRFLFMQSVWLPAVMPLHRLHDRLCQAAEAANRRRYSRKFHRQNP